MKTSDIFNLLEKNIDTVKFLEKYKDEFSNYENVLKRKGSAIPIYVDEDLEFNFTENHLITICDAFLLKSLKDVEVNYLADAITLAESITIADNLFDLLASFTDPEINGKLSEKYVSDITSKIRK